MFDQYTIWYGDFWIKPQVIVIFFLYTACLLHVHHYFSTTKSLLSFTAQSTDTVHTQAHSLLHCFFDPPSKLDNILNFWLKRQIIAALVWRLGLHYISKKIYVSFPYQHVSYKGVFLLTGHWSLPICAHRGTIKGPSHPQTTHNSCAFC